MRYHLFPLVDEGVRYKMLAHRDHRLSYFADETLSGELLELLKRPWYRRIVKWPWMSWEIEADSNEVGYYFWSSDEHIGDEIRKKIIGAYPDMEINKMKSPGFDHWTEDIFITGTSLDLERDYPVKIKTFINEIVDSQSPLVNSLSDLENGQRAVIQLLVQPAINYQNDFDKALRIVKKWDKEKEYEKVELFESNVYSKQTKLLGHCVLRITVQSHDQEDARRLVKEISRSFGHFKSEALNGFKSRERWMQIKPLFLSDWRQRRFPIFERRLRRTILNIEELSGLMRLPSNKVNNSRLTRLEMKNLEPPSEVIQLHKEVLREGTGVKYVKIGTNTFRMRKTDIYMDVKNLSNHLLVLGGSGSGKSVFLQNLMDSIARLKLKGESKTGFFLIDPHGEMSKVFVSNLPDELLKDVNYICPNSREERFFPFNVFDVDFDSTPDSVSKNISEILKRIWPEGWGVRPERNLLHAGIALQHLGEASIININKLLRDYTYCKTVADQLKGEPGKEEIYETLSELSQMLDPENGNSAQMKRQHRELTDSTRNKLEQFSLSSLLGKATGTETCGFRWREWMDQGKLTILDLSKIGNDVEKKMYGSMALTMNYQAALSREDKIENGEEIGLYPIIVDELPSFIDKNEQVIQDMADRTRFVNVPLIGAAQGLVSQMPLGASQAILRNFKSIISYQVNNPDDFETIAKSFNHEDLSGSDVQRTPANYAYMGLNVKRARSRVFSALMDPPLSEKIDKQRVKMLIDRTWQEAMDRESEVKNNRHEDEFKINLDIEIEEHEEKTSVSKKVELSDLALSEIASAEIIDELPVEVPGIDEQELVEDPILDEAILDEPEDSLNQSKEDDDFVFQFKVNTTKVQGKEVVREEDSETDDPWKNLIQANNNE